MNEHLNRLLEAARRVPQTHADAEVQRRSFAYGNTHFENEMITRKMIDEMAEQIGSSSDER